MDRNGEGHNRDIGGTRSLSARRAWIEIMAPTTIITICIAVALRKESVDRNSFCRHPACCVVLSLSARRAWIEICGGAFAKLLALVALRKESVDRNKSNCFSKSQLARSLSARRAWIEI